MGKEGFPIPRSNQLHAQYCLHENGHRIEYLPGYYMSAAIYTCVIMPTSIRVLSSITNSVPFRLRRIIPLNLGVAINIYA